MVTTGDRGQMLLIGGVLLAVAIVTLGIVFNGAVYTSVLAGEGQHDLSADSTIELQQDLRQMIGDGVRHAVRTEPNLSEQREEAKTVVKGIAANLRTYEAQSNRLVNVSVNATIDGEYIAQNSTGNFTYNDNGTIKVNWTMGSDVRVRDFSVNVTGTSGDDFEIRITGDDGETYAINLRNSTVRVIDPSGDVTSCGGTDLYPIDVTGAMVGNESRCNALDFFERIEPPYDIDMVNGSQVTGKYNLTINSNGQGPTSRDRLYGVAVDLVYHSPSMDYNTTLRIAPGEPT